MSIRDDMLEKKRKQVILEEQEPTSDNSSEQQTKPVENTNLRGRVKSASTYANRGKAKKERFLWFRVWVTYLLSMLMKDRGKIPDNIGDKIIITNNMYITKAYMSIIIHIQELGPYTPITLMSVLNELLRERGNRAVLDCTIRNKKYNLEEKDKGLDNRIQAWEKGLSDSTKQNRLKERDARCLYTARVAKSGKQLKRSRIYLTLRSTDIMTLNSAEKIIYDALGQMGCLYLPVRDNIKDTLKYMSIIGNSTEELKRIVPVMTSNAILSQILPNCGSLNDKSGYYLGQNVLNGTPYYIDFSNVSVARNMYLNAPAGVGKTVFAINMAQAAYEEGSACVFMDIKGNEFTNFIKATNGYIISLRPTSIEYINSWAMYKEDTTPEMAESYFKSRVNFSKQQFMILSGIKDRDQLLELEELLDEFHDALYVSIGASATNMNSWSNTLSLNPYEVFSKLENFLTPAKRAQYSLNKTIMGTLRMYFGIDGSKSYIFKREFDYASIMSSDTLSFDFGMLGGSKLTDVEIDLFRLKFQYMSKLNGDYTSKKYAEGRRTFKILEEVQVATPEIKTMYVEEYTLRRSQNQDTLLLGNSIQAVSNDPSTKALIENTRGLFIGELTKDAREIIMEQFGIKHLEPLIKIPGSSARYKNSFVFINNMQDKTLYPILQLQIEKDQDGKFRRYKVNTPVKEKSIMAGN